jgi:hypothetical protein
MFKKLFSTDLAVMPNDAAATTGRGLGTLRTAIADWRYGNDVAAIVGTLNRLPNHRLHMIGLHRDGLVDAVGDMILSAEEDRAIGREVVAILDASADGTFGSYDIPPPEEYSEKAEIVAKNRFR